MNDHRSPEPWPREGSERLAEYGMFTVRRDTLRSPRNGSTHRYEILEAPDGVTVIATTARGEMVLVEQFRHGIRRRSLELPSGILEEGEDPVEGAVRELREETGYEVGDAEALGTLILNPAWQTTRVHVVLARGAVRAGEQELDRGEDVLVRLLPPDEVHSRVRSGEIDSSVVVAALNLFEQSGRAPEGGG